MAIYCVRVLETGIVHLKIEAENADAAYTAVDAMLANGEVTIPDNSYEYDIDVSGVGGNERHADIGL